MPTHTTTGPNRRPGPKEAIMSRFHTSRIVPLAVLELAVGLPTAAIAAPAAAATTYTITDLGSLGDGVSDGLAVNATGQVTGYSYISATIPITCPRYSTQKKCYTHPYHALLYGNGTITDLCTLGGNYSQGNAINRYGEVVGWADTKTGSADSFLWNGKTMTDLSALGASGINDLGQISGTCGNNPGLHACLDSNGTITQLPDPGTFAPINCGRRAINNNGQIAGGCDDTSSY